MIILMFKTQKLIFNINQRFGPPDVVQNSKK